MKPGNLRSQGAKSVEESKDEGGASRALSNSAGRFCFEKQKKRKDDPI
jgi:hypothetical protein